MLLSDRSIKALRRVSPELVIPWKDDMLQPASYELTLAPHCKFLRPDSDVLDPYDVSPLDYSNYIYHDSWFLGPDEFALVSTAERIHLPANIAARVEGKSSLGRIGLAIHTTAGWVDPGFDGQITLELKNLSERVIKLTPGMKICQLAFFQMSTAADRPYGHPELKSRYQGQNGVTVSKGVS